MIVPATRSASSEFSRFLKVRLGTTPKSKSWTFWRRFRRSGHPSDYCCTCECPAATLKLIPCDSPRTRSVPVPRLTTPSTGSGRTWSTTRTCPFRSRRCTKITLPSANGSTSSRCRRQTSAR
uniref:(northern house mosquito) hypothetical protein n=1 Tax=Culex pipiens TaxID=7175 RepID=A0A8D8L403_CULPI